MMDVIDHWLLWFLLGWTVVHYLVQLAVLFWKTRRGRKTRR